MGRVQRGKDLPASEIEGIRAFLESLTGTIPEEAIRTPILPPRERSLSVPASGRASPR